MAVSNSDVPRIDAHHHVWDLAVRDQPWTADLPALRRTFTFDELKPQLADADIAGTIVVQTVALADETPELLALAGRTPHIRGVIGWIDLTAEDVAEQLAALREREGGHRLVGVRHQVQQETDAAWLVRPEVLRGLRAVAAAGLTYDLLVTHDQLPGTLEVVRRTPEVTYVLDHAGKPPLTSRTLAPWREHITALAASSNVAVKLSGLLTESARDWTVATLQPVSDHLLDTFGPQRTMFGSDWPVSTLRAEYANVIEVSEELVSALDSTDRAAVFGRTAARWYRLDDTTRHR